MKKEGQECHGPELHPAPTPTVWLGADHTAGRVPEESLLHPHPSNPGNQPLASLRGRFPHCGFPREESKPGRQQPQAQSIRTPMMGFSSLPTRSEGTGRDPGFLLTPHPVSTCSLSPSASPGGLEEGGQGPGPQPAGRKAAYPPAAAWGPTQPSACPQDNPRLTEDFVAHLETELEQSRLRETETLGALREMQDKVLDMEKVRLGGGQVGRCSGNNGKGEVEVPGALWEAHDQALVKKG